MPSCLLAFALAAPLLVEAEISWVEWLRGAGDKSDQGSASTISEFPPILPGLPGTAPVPPVPSTPISHDAHEDKGEWDTLTQLLDSHDAHEDKGKWDTLTRLLQGWEFTENYVVAVGDARHGRRFLYQGGNLTEKTRIPTGSTSKWPSAMMFAGLVNDGTIASLDDPVHKYIKWWTRDPKDLRSKVTFRMLLSFTSGFGGGHPGEEGNTRAAREWRRVNNVTFSRGGLRERLEKQFGPEARKPCNAQSGHVMACARFIYRNVDLTGVPGQTYSYNSNHLQLAAAVSVAASGLNIQQIIQKYLITPFDMKDSFYRGNCPDFSADLVTTGTDYEKFMWGLLSYNALSKEIMDASEEDSTPFMSNFPTLYGDYGFGHFLMCFDSVYGFTQKCKEAMCHMDPGAFGFIPIIDRKYGYYIQVVAAEIEPLGSYPLSGIPEYLAVAIKPHVDAIYNNDPYPPAQMTHNPNFLTLSVADVNYCLNCKLHPEQCL